MKMKRIFGISFALIVVLGLLTACFATNPQPTLDTNMVQTLAAQTVSARQTLAVVETKVALLTLQPTQAPVIITATVPTATKTLIPTKTPIPATPTFLPTATEETPCNVAKFVTDVTIPDGTSIAPEASFIKTWRLQNKGTCTWSTNYSVVFVSGDAMSGPASFTMPKSVAPGETVDVSVTLVAPKDPGSYSGYWRLRSASGTSFGTGIDYNTNFFVKIKVAIPTLSDLHLTTNFCNATWKTANGSIPCPSTAYDFTKGSVNVLTAPKLEGGSTDNEPALVMVPNTGAGGQLIGRYPTLKIKTGDHFKSLTGCLDGYKDCSVTFALYYSVDGGSDVLLGSWDHKYGDALNLVDYDLSSLDGKNVQFVLLVKNNNATAKDDAAFWLNPQIKRP